MIKVSASKFRQNLFDYLDRLSQGETIIILRNSQEVARVIPTEPTNWRNKMSCQAKLLVSPEELIEPLEDIWESYAQ